MVTVSLSPGEWIHLSWVGHRRMVFAFWRGPAPQAKGTKRIPPMYHSLRRESIENTNSDNAIGVKSIRPTWFEDIVTSQGASISNRTRTAMHGLKLVIKEEALPLKEQPEFPALAEAPIEAQPCKSLRTCLGIRPERDLVEINRKAPNGLIMQCGIRNTWNPGQASPYNNCGRAQSQPSHRKHPLL